MNSETVSNIIVETSNMKMVEEVTSKGYIKSYMYRVYKRHSLWNLAGILSSGGLWYELYYSPDKQLMMEKYYEDV